MGSTATEHLLRLARHAAADRRAWDRVLDLLPGLALRVTDDGFDVARAPVAGYDPAVSAAAVVAAARRIGCVLGAARARDVVALAGHPSGRRLALPGGYTAEVAFDRLRVYKKSSVPRPERLATPGPRGESVFGAFVVRWDEAPAPPALDRAGWTTWVGPGWAMRAHQTGDRLLPLGGVGHRPVRRLLMEARVPRGAREGYPVVTHGDAVVWVPGLCRSALDVPAPGTPAVRLDVIRQGDGAPG